MALLLIDAAHRHASRPAVEDDAGVTTYGELLSRSAVLAARLLEGRDDLREARVAFLVAPSADWVVVQWAIWRAGGIAVPLSPSHPPAELAYVLADADVAMVVAAPEFAAALGPLAAAQGVPLVGVGETAPTAALPAITDDRRAMILYTSGTTGRPKGVVTTHAQIAAQVQALVAAWGWHADDRILLVLPLHHVHGIVNVVGCALASGATVLMRPRFDATDAWRHLQQSRLTLFMAVPTIYARLIAAWESAAPDAQAAMSAASRRLRLMVSGSAALPVTTLERWHAIAGHVLLERYGMTELGMALSNPLAGTRVPGHVGLPLPGVSVRVVDEQGNTLPDHEAGELEVRGPNVFLEYWRRPDETRAAFRDGWFRTGDVAVLEETEGGPSWRLLGRRSTDILKTGGYKVSALEIEEALRTHPAVAECAVVGLPDDEWGERIAAAVELRAGGALSLDGMRAFLKGHLAPYKVPSRLAVVDALPRNARGKVVKPDVVRRLREG